jgi:hypothetical protein
VGQSEKSGVEEISADREIRRRLELMPKFGIEIAY